MNRNEAKSLSIVIPVMNEVENLPILVKEIHKVMEGYDRFSDWQVILIDDGSTDGTTELIRNLADGDQRISAVVFRKNFGKSAALMAGFERVRGDYVITMDGDLQDNPAEIPALVAKLDEGFDLVSGWKAKRLDPIEKRWPSKVFNGVISRVSKVYIHDFNCGLKSYRRWCVQSLILYGNQYRFIPAILGWNGAKITEIPVDHRKRQFGKSKYGIKRYLHGAFDLFTLLLVTRFSQAPLYFFGLVSLPFVGTGALIFLYLLSLHILFLASGGDMGESMRTRPFLVISFSSMIVGLQIFLFGLLSELILRVAPGDRRRIIREEIHSPQGDS